MSFEWFGDHACDTQIDKLLLFANLCLCCKQNRWDVLRCRIGLQLPKGRRAIHIRHHNI